jgi:hypothetical protein
MKGIVIEPGCSKGQQYRLVREAVARVPVGATVQGVIEVLGEPDLRGGAELDGPHRFQALMSHVAGGDTGVRYGNDDPVEEVLVYQDPVRPRRRYLFGIRAGAVSSRWQETSQRGK